MTGTGEGREESFSEVAGDSRVGFAGMENREQGDAQNQRRENQVCTFSTAQVTPAGC